MYGSESQQSVCSSAPRPFDDTGIRSYSLTSYGSRRGPSRRPSSSMRTHSSMGLQRPRSPFPYPTRLKRPGVRPASPALTENGSVDYSRMVGVDHVSYVGASAVTGKSWVLTHLRGLSTGLTSRCILAAPGGCRHFPFCRTPISLHDRLSTTALTHHDMPMNTGGPVIILARPGEPAIVRGSGTGRRRTRVSERQA